MDIKEIAKILVELSQKEIDELTSTILIEYGISADISLQPLGIVPTFEIPSNENDGFDVIMWDIGEKRISVMKTVKEFLNVGLRDAKDIIDSAPCSIKEFASLEEAKTLKYELEKVGAKIEIN